MKTCTKCKISKSIDNFTKSSNSKDKLRSWCKKCFADYDKNRRQQLSPNYKRGRTLVRYWPNLSPIEAFLEYEKLLKTQNNACIICGNTKSIKTKSLVVDHCHNTGKVRGILCDVCNLGLGYFKDDVELMKRAIKYIKGEL